MGRRRRLQAYHAEERERTLNLWQQIREKENRGRWTARPIKDIHPWYRDWWRGELLLDPIPKRPWVLSRVPAQDGKTPEPGVSVS